MVPPPLSVGSDIFSLTNLGKDTRMENTNLITVTL